LWISRIWLEVFSALKVSLIALGKNKRIATSLNVPGVCTVWKVVSLSLLFPEFKTRFLSNQQERFGTSQWLPYYP